MAPHPIREHRIRRLRRTERGASLVEYALLVALISLACLAAVTSFGGATGNSLNRSASMITNAGP